MISVLDVERAAERERAGRRTAASTASTRASASSPTSRRRACSSASTEHIVDDPARRPQRRRRRADADGSVVRAHASRSPSRPSRPSRTAASSSCPRTGRKTYFDWMHNIQDWCISRQLWWGHRIPAWYDDAGNVYVGARRGRGAAQVRPRRRRCRCARTRTCSTPGSRRRSGRSRRSAGPTRRRSCATFYPTNVLVTSFDIIFFWVARMMMMGLKFIGRRAVPRGLHPRPRARSRRATRCRSRRATSWTRSISSTASISTTLLKKRTDGLMQTALAGRHREQRRARSSRTASRRRHRRAALHVRLAGDDGPRRALRPRARRRLSPLLQQALERLGVRASASSTASTTAPHRARHRRIAGFARGSRATIASVHENFATYRLDLVAQTLYDFAWHELCDWYLELTKAVLTDPAADPALRRGAQRTLVDVLGSLLKLLHPLMPFVTEELWLELVETTRRRRARRSCSSRFREHARLRRRRGRRGRDRLAQGLRRRHPPDSRRGEPAALGHADACGSPTRRDLDRARVERHASHLRKLAGLERIEFVAAGETRQRRRHRPARRHADPRAARGAHRRRRRARPARQAAREDARRSRQGAAQAREPELRRQRARRHRRQGARAHRRARRSAPRSSSSSSPASPSS